MSELSGTVVITGAAGGMGRPAAQRFAAQGRPLLLCDLHSAPLEALAQDLRDQGAHVQTLAADVAEPDYPARVINALHGQPISALVHTAGLSPTMSDAARIFAVNYDASLRLINGLFEHFERGASVVLISSVSAYMLNDARLLDAIRHFVVTGDTIGIAPLLQDAGTSYAVSKRAIVHLVEHKAQAFGARGVRINSIAPGFIDTAMGRAEAQSNAQLRAMIGMVPQERMGLGDEIAAVAEFLCSPAASYVSGTDIRVDGGIIGLLSMKDAGAKETA